MTRRAHTGGRPVRAGAAIGGGAAAFGRRVRERYGHATPWMAPPDFAYARGAVLHLHHSRVSITAAIAPRWYLQAHAPIPRAWVIERLHQHTRLCERPTAAASRPVIPATAPVNMLARSSRHETLIVRRETVLRTSVPPRPAAPPAPVFPSRPVSMVLRRATASPGIMAGPPAPPVASPGAGQVPERGRAPVSFHTPAIPRAIPLSASELRALTDHVVTALGHRVVAQRERMGNR